MNFICPIHKITAYNMRYSFTKHKKTVSCRTDWYFCIKCNDIVRTTSKPNPKLQCQKRTSLIELRQIICQMLQDNKINTKQLFHNLDPYIRFKPTFHNYRVQVIIVKPSPYGDNLDKDTFFEELK